MSITKQALSYFSIYKKYLGKRLYIVFFLSIIAAFAEGLGITLLLPIIELSGFKSPTDPGNDNVFRYYLYELLSLIGINDSLPGILVLFGIIFIFKGIIIFIGNAYQTYLKSQLLFEIKMKMFQSYKNMSYEYYTGKNTGHFINIINNQINKFIGSFDRYKIFLSTIILSIAYVFTAFLIAWEFAVTALVGGLLLLFLFRKLNKYVHIISRKAAKEQSKLNRFLIQVMQAYKYLASTSSIGHIEKRIERSVSTLSGFIRSQGYAAAFTSSVIEPITVLFLIALILFQILVLESPLPPIIVSLLLFNRALAKMMGIQLAWQKTMSQIGSLEIVEQEFEQLSLNQEQKGKIEIGTFSESIEFKNVTFAYNGGGGKRILENISMIIPQNSTIALVGPSGAGKSTLVDLLTLMLKPCKGQILIDGICGTNVDLSSWRSQIGYVSQEKIIFDDSVANNISLWKTKSDSGVSDKVKIAAEQAYATNFIKDLPEKFETIVGENGVRLSGGQRQRIFLARELFKLPNLLILDEATSALDSHSEIFIKNSIETLKGKTTIVMIAHRLSTIKNADYIYVLDNGVIVESGSYKSLYEKNESSFRKMINCQSL